MSGSASAITIRGVWNRGVTDRLRKEIERSSGRRNAPMLPREESLAPSPTKRPFAKSSPHVGEPVEPPPVSPARGPPTEWPELVQAYDDCDGDVMQAAADELPAHSMAVPDQPPTLTRTILAGS